MQYSFKVAFTILFSLSFAPLSAFASPDLPPGLEKLRPHPSSECFAAVGTASKPGSTNLAEDEFSKMPVIPAPTAPKIPNAHDPEAKGDEAIIIKPRNPPFQVTHWERVICEANLTLDVKKWISEKLVTKGFLVVSEDFLIDLDKNWVTIYPAITNFQKNSDLAVGGITFSTLAALGETKVK